MSAPGNARPSDRTADIAEAWLDLQRHLEWTYGLPSLPFILSDSRTVLDEVLVRVRLFARQHGCALHEIEVGDDPGPQVRALLPGEGIAWLTVAGSASEQEGRWRRLLHLLNELRTPLNRDFHGAVIIAGPASVAALAAGVAGDLWAVRSFVRTVASPALPVSPPARLENHDEFGDPIGRSTSQPVPADRRGPATREVIDLVRRSSREAVRGDVAEAYRLMERAAELAVTDTAETRGLVRLSHAGLAIEQEDWPLAQRLLAAPAEPDVSPSLERPLLDARGRLAQRFGDWAVAAEAYRRSLELSREILERSPSDGAARDVSVSLDNVGRVAEARGDWAAAEAAYAESLGLARELRDRLGTPESVRDVSISLNNLGRVAEARGDWAAAEAAFTEAAELFRLVADTVRTPVAEEEATTAQARLAELQERRAAETAD
ncbi:MAG TPA: tetratricopeptide repeat protein [Jatrophihabitans sp.]|nr:tetratricopeptide repeat protein [Jatrophihabitans sp.]